MKDEKFHQFFNRRHLTEFEQDGLREEALRARRVEQEQAAIIKVLADALEAQKDEGLPTDGAWHSARCMGAGRASCSDDCEQAREALKLAGRLP
jgi:hypothetical protein